MKPSNMIKICTTIFTILLLLSCILVGCSRNDTTNSSNTTSTLEPNKSSSDYVLAQTKNDGTTQYSTDQGLSWMTEDDFLKQYPSNNIVWWTYDEYKTFIDEQKKSLQEMVDNEITGYTSTKGNFVWTQEIADETIAKYEKDLEAIKNGTKISKSIDFEDGKDSSDIAYESYHDEPTEPKQNEIEITLPNGETKSFTSDGNDKDQLIKQVESFCKQQIENGSMSELEFDAIIKNITP